MDEVYLLSIWFNAFPCKLYIEKSIVIKCFIYIKDQTPKINNKESLRIFCTKNSVDLSRLINVRFTGYN